MPRHSSIGRGQSKSQPLLSLGDAVPLKHQVNYEHNSCVCKIFFRPNYLCLASIIHNSTSLGPLDSPCGLVYIKVLNILYETGYKVDCHPRGCMIQNVTKKSVTVLGVLASNILSYSYHYTAQAIPAPACSSIKSAFANRRSSKSCTPAPLESLVFESGSCDRPLGNAAIAPTALSLAALGGVIGLFFWLFLELRVVFGETDESGRAWVLGRGAQLDLGVESSSEPKVKKSLRSGEGSDVSMMCPSDSGVSR